MAEPDNEFPQYRDGDVHIIINGSRQYILHSQLLRTHSPAMRKLLGGDHGPQLSSKAIKKGITVRYRLELVDKAEGEDEDTDTATEGANLSVKLAPVQMNGEGRPADGRGIRLDLENGLEVDPIHEAYSTVLGALYGRAVSLGAFGNDTLDNMLSMAINVHAVAAELGVVNLITKPIEADLNSHGQLLYRSISDKPGPWLVFALQIRSRLIFREALIHAIGQYHTDNMQFMINKDFFSTPVLNLMTKKYTILLEGLKTAQMKMLSYYPQILHRHLTVGLADRDNIGRGSYSNDIFAWMALNAFRHYIAQNVAADCTHHDKDMGYEFIQMIAKGGEEYMRKPDLQTFYGLFPMTGKGQVVFENHIENTKEHCRSFAQDFMVNTTHLDIKTYPSKHFTCTKVDWEDLKVVGTQ
ncbi:uncharacterized protein LTR77_005251 [Saxophila tyrrhenica]|uniref:BTB domain-containing protein n=1 Tax=Saxophila tyrrhenica TaxID=1690608 RepID=A0AAV9PBF7_9PEZI|nr:hypothetical protein LTR77_005251 [Saxophila tyrrhenica]